VQIGRETENTGTLSVASIFLLTAFSMPDILTTPAGTLAGEADSCEVDAALGGVVGAAGASGLGASGFLIPKAISTLL